MLNQQPTLTDTTSGSPCNIARAGRDVQDGIGGRYGGTNLYRVMNC